MRNLKNWLFPILTCLTVAALALLPLRLSTLEDGELTGAVHTEPLPEDSNFPFKPPELPGRVWLLAQYSTQPEFLTIVGQEPDEEKLAELTAQARAELQTLTDAGVLPEGLSVDDSSFAGSLLYLRDQTDLSSAAFSLLHAYNPETGEDLSLYLDGESGHILALELTSRFFYEYPQQAETLGRAFFDGLGLEYEMLETYDGSIACFRVPDSKTLYWVHQLRNLLSIEPQMDWSMLDSSFREALGIEPNDSTSMQKY